MAIARSTARPMITRSLPRPRLTLRRPALGLRREDLLVKASAPWAIGVPVAVFALVVVGALLEPAPAHEATGIQAFVDGVITNALLIGFTASAIGGFGLRRWGIAASLAVALFTLGLVISCPVSGHHTWGIWFAGEMACVLAATGVALVGMSRTRP
jgi:hypothetical protein